MPFTKWFHVALLSLLYIVCISFYTIGRLLSRYAQIIPVKQLTFKVFHKECRWFIFDHEKIFFKVSTPTLNFMCMNLYLCMLCLISVQLGLAASLSAFNKYLLNWLECVLFQAPFKPLTLLYFSLFAFFSTQFKCLIFKRKKIRRQALRGDKTEGLPFREAKSYTVGSQGQLLIIPISKCVCWCQEFL